MPMAEQSKYNDAERCAKHSQAKEAGYKGSCLAVSSCMVKGQASYLNSAIYSMHSEVSKL